MMNSKKEVEDLKRQLRAVKSCNGDCHHCESIIFRSANIGRNICFAFACAKAPALGAISERPSQMRGEVVEALEFELSLLSV